MVESVCESERERECVCKKERERRDGYGYIERGARNRFSLLSKWCKITETRKKSIILYAT